MKPPWPGDKLARRARSGRIGSSALSAVVALLVVAHLGGLVTLSGCRGAARTTSFDNVQVSRYRWHLDEKGLKVRVVGEVRNTGSVVVAAVAVRAVLRNARGAVRGENTIVLDDIQPGEARVFAQDVMWHGGAVRVRLEVRSPAAAS